MKIASPLVLGVATGVAVAVVYSRAAAPIDVLPPLIAIGACFLIYTADNFFAQRRMRHLLREPSEPENSDDHNHELPKAAEPFRSKLNGDSHSAMSMPPAAPVRIFYEKDRIVGTGTAWPRSALTIAVDEASDDEQVIPFKATDLISYIAAHLQAQGSVGQQTDGYAYSQVFLQDKWQPLRIPRPPANGTAPGESRQYAEFQSFTHGLPDLDVREVIAVPAPAIKVVPIWWLFLRYVTPRLLGRRRRDQAQLSDQEYSTLVKKAPTASPERHYVRASSMTWDGQIITSIYVSAVLQAHYLRVLIRPYVLAPVGPELRQAKDLAQRHIVVQAGGAVKCTIRQSAVVIERLHRLGHRDSNKSASPARPKLASTREHYAQYFTDNMHHTEDADRMIQVMELKVFRVTRQYLIAHNVDLEDYDRQVQVFINSTVIGDIKNNSGNIAVGDNNKQKQGPSSGSNEGQDSK